MKFLILVAAAITLVGCKTVEVVSYQYRSSTMLGTRTVDISKDSVVTMFTGRTEDKRTSRVTTAQEWEELQTGVKTVKLEEIANLPSPTNGRQTDAAPYGMLTISTKDSTFQSASFDGFNAHQSLAPLMGTIQKISNSELNK